MNYYDCQQLLKILPSEIQPKVADKKTASGNLYIENLFVSDAYKYESKWRLPDGGFGRALINFFDKLFRCVPGWTEAFIFKSETLGWESSGQYDLEWQALMRIFDYKAKSIVGFSASPEEFGEFIWHVWSLVIFQWCGADDFYIWLDDATIFCRIDEDHIMTLQTADESLHEKITKSLQEFGIKG